MTRSVWEQPERSHLAKQPGADFIVDVSTWRETKARALMAHGTQRAGVDRIFLNRSDRDAVLGIEVFRLGAGEMPKRVPADDLFADL